MKPENIIYVKEIFNSVCSDIAVKCAAAIFYVPYIFLFDPTQKTGLQALLVLILFDMLTGIAAAKKSGEIIKSSKVIRTVIKICFYYLFISAGYLTEKTIGINLFLDESILAVLAFTELISITENMGNLGYAVPKKMLNKLHELRDKE